jgi:selenide, water dikinase
VLRHVQPFRDPAILVDGTTFDDAAVYRIDEERALVATVDFFTPIVDDAADFGRIAAANALSDIYAMGGSPILALNLLGFPRDRLGEGLLEAIVAGGAALMASAGVPVVGGHSIDDPEPKFGYCVLGMVHPDRITRNDSARAGDALVLTKPLGTGVIATAIKRGDAADDVVVAATAAMTTLNRAAAEAMLAAGASACTDVTGYGLLGHLRSLCRASGLAATVDAGAVPLLPGALQLAAGGAVPGGTRRNFQELHDDVTWHAAVPEPLRILLCDAQTSGGLLIALPRDRLPELRRRLALSDTPCATIGTLRPGPPGTINVDP